MTEFRNRRFYGLLTDAANRLYMLEAKTYRLRRLPLEHFDPERQSLIIFGDDFYWTVQITGEKEVKYYAVNATDYSLAARKSVALPLGKAERVGQYLFPFELTFTSYGDKYVFGRIGCFPVYAFLLNFIIAVGYAWWQKQSAGRDFLYLPVLLLFVFGLFALAPVFFLEQRRYRGTGPCVERL